MTTPGTEFFSTALLAGATSEAPRKCLIGLEGGSVVDTVWKTLLMLVAELLAVVLSPLLALCLPLTGGVGKDLALGEVVIRVAPFVVEAAAIVVVVAILVVVDSVVVSSRGSAHAHLQVASAKGPPGQPSAHAQ